MNNIITFNPLKHHLKEIQKFIKAPPKGYLEILKTIGSSQTDLYTGNISIGEIEHEITEHLFSHQLTDKELYINWIENAGGYRNLILSDGSKWILRVSENNEQFVHIHPGRYSPLSIRVKAGALKTAICFLIRVEPTFNIIVSNQLINDSRIGIGFSPLKDSTECNHINKIIKIIQSL